MGSVDDAKVAVTQAQEALDAASTVLNDVESESTVDSPVVTGITVHYSNGVTAEFTMEDVSTGDIPDSAINAAETPVESNSTETDSDTSDKSAPAADPGESPAPEIPVSGGVAAGTIPE